MGWHRELLIGFGLGTTGIDPHGARIVPGALMEVGDGEVRIRRERPADVEIPAGAVAVHGTSDERATAGGRPADGMADALAGVPTSCRRSGVPVLARNAAFCPRTPEAFRVSHGEARCRPAAHAGTRAA